MKAIRKSDGKIIDVKVHGWNGDCAVSYHTDFKDFYKPEDLDFNVPKESEQPSSFDWQTFRAEAAKDILCAIIQSGYCGEDRIAHQSELAVGYANALVLKLEEKEEK